MVNEKLQKLWWAMPTLLSNIWDFIAIDLPYIPSLRRRGCREGLPLDVEKNSFF
jgi:hypothetical protein